MTKRIRNTGKTELISPQGQSNTVALPADLVDRVHRRTNESRRQNTRQAYGAHWTAFWSWCESVDVEPLPADPMTVAAYIEFRAEPPAGTLRQVVGMTRQADAELKPLSFSSLKAHLAGIRAAHVAQGHESPTDHDGLKAVLRGILNTKQNVHQPKAALEADFLSSILEGMGSETAAELRDRALLLVGFAAALRRSEIAGLDVKDVRFESDTNGLTGARLFLRGTKTDKSGEGQEVFIPADGRPEADPARALRAWIDFAGISKGPVFCRVNRHGHIGAAALTGHGIAAIIKRHVAAVGLNPKDFSGHSLRRGFVTSATQAGAAIAEIAAVTRHKDKNVLINYVETKAMEKSHPLRRMNLCL